MTVKVMVLEDDEFMAQFISAMLQEEGMESEICTEFDMSKEFYASYMPDVILADLYMPDSKGKIIKAGYKFADFVHSIDDCIPVVILSAETNLRIRIESFTHGCTLFLSKPIDKSILIPKLKKLGKLSKLHKDMADRTCLISAVKSCIPKEAQRWHS